MDDKILALPLGNGGCNYFAVKLQKAAAGHRKTAVVFKKIKHSEVFCALDIVGSVGNSDLRNKILYPASVFRSYFCVYTVRICLVEEIEMA